VSRRLGVLPLRVILTGDALQQLRRLPSHSVDAFLSSPPYYQLRNYQVEGQLGLEPTVDAWVANLRQVMREVARVLKPSGSAWLNLGDSYSRHLRFGAPPKSLLLGPERLALALIEDGWTIRSKVIWSKTQAMPSSVRDRLSCTWEVVYLLTRSPHYFFDLDAIRAPHRSSLNRPTKGADYPPASATPPTWAGPLAGNNSGLIKMKAAGLVGHPLGKNPGDVWSLPSANFKGQHFATFPKALIERPLLASVPERVCRRCGRPWERQLVRSVGQLAIRGELRPVCRCRQGWQPGVVLDPFFGSGTVGLVAETHHRDWVGIELNPHFVALANDRIARAREEVINQTERRSA
jgi:site-specific DNA-methyltransferase (adenine-specific)